MMPNDDEIETFAARDREPVPLHQGRWVRPLSDFLGTEEPEDDDAGDWLIRDIVPRAEPTLFAGPPKSGKTWVAADISIAVASGTDWVGNENTARGPRRVLAVLLEDSERRLRKRLWQLCRGRGISPTSLGAHLSITRKPFGIPDKMDRSALVSELKRWKPALVIVDNLTRTMIGDPNSTRDAAMFAREWLGLTQDTGATWMFLHHTRKEFSGTPVGADGERQRGSALDRVRGSGDFPAAARNVVVIAPMRGDDTKQVSQVEIGGNLDLKRSKFALGFERGDVDGRPFVRLTDLGDPDMIRTEVKAKRATVKAELTEHERRKRMLAALELANAAGTVSIPGLMMRAGCSQATAQRVLADLRERATPLLLKERHGHVLTDAGRTELGRLVPMEEA